MQTNDYGVKGLSRRTALKLIGGLAMSLAGGKLMAGVQPDNNRTGPSPLLRPIPATGEMIPAVGLGTARTFSLAGLGMGRRGTVAEAGASPEELATLKEVLKLLHAEGGRLIDSSPMYGTAEELVGDFAAELGIVDELFMTTKVWVDGREAGIRQMEESMALLHTEPLDVMLIHNLRDWRTHYRTLRDWQEQGRLRYIGISHSQTAAHGEVERVLRAERFDIFQINYNILDSNADERLFPLAEEQGLAVLVNEPFGSGGLFGRVKGRSLPPWAAEFDAKSWAQFFLKFVIGHPMVTCALPATSKPKHVVDNTRAMYGPLPDAAQRKRMAEFIQAL